MLDGCEGNLGMSFLYKVVYIRFYFIGTHDEMEEIYKETLAARGGRQTGKYTYKYTGEMKKKKVIHLKKFV
jgi:hypothetical protein